ncbi:MAG TPA: beta-galactosidase, partial [Polyangiaceae bacterium]
LSAVQGLGIEIIDIYVPWGVHEDASGVCDFGERNPRLDVERFLELTQQLGLYAIVRPGPHINAELTFFGIPERVIWDPACQARSPRNTPVVLPVPPLAFPVPSYASRAFLDEAARWLEIVGKRLAKWVWPRGPIVMTQIDNEGAMYFRDGVYDQDHHPDAVAQYRAFLLAKYGSLDAVREVLGDPGLSLETLQPPAQLSGSTLLDLARHLDAAEAQEECIARALSHMRAALEGAGLRGVPTTHNLPFGEGSTPLDPVRVNSVVDLVGLDYYHVASETTRAEIARRTSDLSARASERGYAPFACELGAGFPPFFPPITEGDSAFAALCALAYGLRGFNLYMAVERDRWIGAPIDRHGWRRPFAEFWEKLVSALQRLDFASLTRHVDVHVVVPRNLRRLSRVMHAFGPVSLSAFHVSGGSAEQACFEDEFGAGSPLVIDADRFLHMLERALDSECIPYAVVAGDLIERALRLGKWTLLACAGGLETEIRDSLRKAEFSGRALTLGPHAVERDAVFRPLATPFPLSNHATVVGQLPLDEARIAEAVRDAKVKLSLDSLACRPRDVFATVHRDARGEPRVAFLINPNAEARRATLELPGVARLVDALDGAEFHASFRAIELALPPHTVRMFELFS